MTAWSEAELRRRGSATVTASWAAYAAATSDGAVRRLPGVAAAVFPGEPERSVYNNAILEHGLPVTARAAAIAAMEHAYAAAGVADFAAWVHEDDAAMCDELRARGYATAETTRAMGMAIDDLRPARPDLDARPAGWPEYLRASELPADLLPAGDHAGLHVLVVRHGDEPVAAGLAFDLDGDCGIYNVGTVERFRRRGVGTALTARMLYGARDRGCVTATLQATPMGERVYAAVGFRDLGRIVEFAPPPGAADRR